MNALNVMHLAHAGERDHVGGDFQRADHRRAYPLALRGVTYRSVGAAALLSRNLLVYGLGGIVLPFIGIKVIDLAVTALHLL